MAIKPKKHKIGPRFPSANDMSKNQNSYALFSEIPYFSLFLTSNRPEFYVEKPRNPRYCNFFACMDIFYGETHDEGY